MTLRELLFRVITSWQVIAVAVAVIFYFMLVSYAARISGRRPKSVTLDMAPKKTKEERPADAVPQASGDDLGLEEETVS